MPAITHYTRSLDEVARERARPDLERAMQAVRSVAERVYVDPETVAARVSAAIVDGNIERAELVKSIAERPEQFGELLGKGSRLGDSKDRAAARHYAKSLSHHIASSAQTWERRLEAERKSETWNREKRDLIEVPGLTKGSESLLTRLDQQPYEHKSKFLARLLASPEGRRAINEAKAVANALERRFGSAEARNWNDDLRIDSEIPAAIERIKAVARIADRAQREEISLRYELTRRLGKDLGLGM
ncbi:BID domain-containing protein [Rhizobium calliandrae]|uniref:BID domain-containing protein n=1 Tax=Rhizobium calliandrae TaxID=1312182 RepID=A0ABT7KQH7_9HYPH|nr:BID domain-containing protein [Rhizobium calliandrae]